MGEQKIMTETIKLIADYGVVAGAFIFMLYQNYIDRKRLLEIISKQGDIIKNTSSVLQEISHTLENINNSIMRLECDVESLKDKIKNKIGE